MRTVLKVVAGAAAVAFVAVAIAFGLFVSQFGDRSPARVIARNERTEPAVLFFCDARRSLGECRGRPIPARTIVSNLLREISSESGFRGEIIVTDDTCQVLFRTEYAVNEDLAVVILRNDVEVRTDISGWSELNKPGFERLPEARPDVACSFGEG